MLLQDTLLVLLIDSMSCLMSAMVTDAFILAGGGDSCRRLVVLFSGMGYW